MGPFAQPVISAQGAPVWSPFFFLSPPPSGGISNFGLFIYLSSAERSTPVDRPSRRSDVPDDNCNGDTVVRPVRVLSITDNRLQPERAPQSEFSPSAMRIKTPARGRAGWDKHRPEMFYRISICTFGPRDPLERPKNGIYARVFRDGSL